MHTSPLLTCKYVKYFFSSSSSSAVEVVFLHAVPSREQTLNATGQRCTWTPYTVLRGFATPRQRVVLFFFIVIFWHHSPLDPLLSVVVASAFRDRSLRRRYTNRVRWPLPNARERYPARKTILHADTRLSTRGKKKYRISMSYPGPCGWRIFFTTFPTSPETTRASNEPPP